MDPMASPDRQCVLELKCARFERGKQRVDIGNQEIGRLN
jgi:hypothetical protein